MRLKITAGADHLVRSTDEAPGVLGVGNPGEDLAFCFYSDPRWEPTPRVRREAERRTRAGLIDPILERSPDSAREYATPLALEDVLAGVTEHEVCIALLLMVRATAATLAPEWIACFDFDGLAGYAEWAKDAVPRLADHAHDLSAGS
ncbi:MAG: hypothetical protein WKF96_00280 [Solirubrobacteraceae bacterium]